MSLIVFFKTPKFYGIAGDRLIMNEPEPRDYIYSKTQKVFIGGKALFGIVGKRFLMFEKILEKGEIKSSLALEKLIKKHSVWFQSVKRTFFYCLTENSFFEFNPD